jgi:hypothetical protein
MVTDQPVEPSGRKRECGHEHDHVPAGTNQRSCAAQSLPIVGDVLEDVQRDECRVSAGRRLFAQVDGLDDHAGVVGEPGMEALQRDGVEVGDGDVLDAELEPQRGVGADAAACLDRVVAEVRQRQLGKPAVVVLGGFEGLEDSQLKVVVVGQLANA